MLAATSVLYVLFALGAAGLYALAPRSWRVPLLLAVSLAFYASFNWRFVFLLLAVIAAAYGGARAIAAAPGKTWRLWAAILVVLSPLLFYKYALELFESLRLALVPVSSLDFGGYGAVLIPVGLSFFTFQCLGYLIDVARGYYPAERNALRFAAFVAFFPTLLSGPIERWPAFSRQIEEARRATPDQALDGLLLMAWGLFMKLAVGDALGTYVDAVYGYGGNNTAASVIAGLGAFTLQLYVDFCGYSLIALGTGKLFGVELTANFRQPLFARNILDFWQRWHISLTRWIGDYIYRPLALRLVRWRKAPRGALELAALLATWLSMGLWHGANWTFVAFGACQAALVFGHGRWAKMRRGKPSALAALAGWAATMMAVALTFGLIRANSLSEYGAMLGALLGGQWEPVPFSDWRKVAAGLALILAVDAFRRFRPGFVLRSAEIRASLTGLLVLAVILYGHEHAKAFIYFRF